MRSIFACEQHYGVSGAILIDGKMSNAKIRRNSENCDHICNEYLFYNNKNCFKINSIDTAIYARKYVLVEFIGADFDKRKENFLNDRINTFYTIITVCGIKAPLCVSGNGFR